MNEKVNPVIYKITNDINNKIYVGQTWIGIEKRFKRHCSESRWKNTKNMPIVLAIQKYGKEHFKISILEELPIDSKQSLLDDREVYWSDTLKTISPYGYNLRVGCAGGRISNETKKKIGNSNKGKKVTEETIKKLIASHIGHKVKEETKIKLSNFNKGKKLSQEHKNKIRNSLLGNRMSDSTKEKQSFKKIKYLYTLVSPDGKIYKTNNLLKFIKENKLNVHIYDVINKKANYCLGWYGTKELI